LKRSHNSDYRQAIRDIKASDSRRRCTMIYVYIVICSAIISIAISLSLSAIDIYIRRRKDARWKNKDK